MHFCRKDTAQTTLKHLLLSLLRVHFEVSASNGGYVEIINFDHSGTIGSPKYYTGQTITHKAELVIDLIKPVHCSVGSTCSDNMLDRGPPITKAVSE